MEGGKQAGAVRYEPLRNSTQPAEKRGNNYPSNQSIVSNTSRIQSCSNILVKNGQAVAVAFKTSQRPLDHNHNKSAERLSFSQ